MTHNTKEVEEYNYPSIEHNGEQWIRLVDHIALTSLELQKAREEAYEHAEIVRQRTLNEIKQKIEDNVPYGGAKERVYAIIDQYLPELDQPITNEDNLK